jgi:hypothetical protein
MFVAIIDVFLTPNVALAKKHHSSEDDGFISPSPSTTPGSSGSCEDSTSTYCTFHKLGSGLREGINGLGDRLTGK